MINQIPNDLVAGKSEEELLRVENQYWADLATDLLALEDNPHFKRLILEGYFKDKAINGVSMLATDHVKRGGLRGDIMEQLVAISHLEDYFIMVKSIGLAPEEEFDDSEE